MSGATKATTEGQETMGTMEHLAAGDPYAEATALELWAAGELPDAAAQAGAGVMAGVMTGVLVLLAAFFVALAPGV